jgi:hypothetical protein
MSAEVRAKCLRTRVSLALVATLALLPSTAAAAVAHPLRHVLRSYKSVTGTWVGTITNGASVRRIALQLHERPGGDVLAYVLGGTSYATVTEAHRSGNRLTMTLELRDPEGSYSSTVDATVAGTAITGAVAGVLGPGELALRSTNAVVDERRFIFALLDGEGNPEAATELAAALEGASLAAGAFAGQSACDLWSCAGVVTSFGETAGTLQVGLASAGGCPGTGSATLQLQPESKVYSGDQTFTDCHGTRSGPIFAAKSAAASSVHIAQMEAALARLADALESPAPLGAAHPAFSSGYLHNGKTQVEILAAYERERILHTDIRASFPRLRGARTLPDPEIYPDFVAPLGVDFDARRTGVPSAGGEREVIADSVAWPEEENRLGVWAMEDGTFRILGNQFPPLDLPFAYTIGSTGLEVPTAGGTLYTSIGPYGGHFGPIAGHPYGDSKASFDGFLTRDDGDLTELVGNGDGIRQPGETWGYWGGTSGEVIRAKIPVYIAPMDGTVTELHYLAAPTGVYFDDVPQWSVIISFSDEIRLLLDHVGAIVPELRAKILAATGVDTATYAGPVGELLHGARIPVARGEPLARPQMMAQAIPGFPGYFRGNGAFPERPWAQMEFPVLGPTGVSGQDRKVCVFAFLPEAKRAGFQSVLDADMADPQSQRWASQFAAPKWQWGAEGRLCMRYSPAPQDFRSLLTDLGGWFEVDGPTTTYDEIVAFAPIAKDVATYDPARYDSVAVDTLVLRTRPAGHTYSWLMPDGSTLQPYYPAGEILELTDATMLIKWRDMGYRPGGVESPVYQAAAYVLNNDGLKIRWGSFAATRMAAALPILTALTPCNDTDVICYDHTVQPGI